MTYATKEISNSDDLIDIRDVIDRVEHLAQLREPGPVDLGEDNDTDQDTLFAELASLEALIEACRGNGGDYEYDGDWFPGGLIRDSYFEDFAREEAEEIGAIKDEVTWPYRCIDWKQAARELQMDYTAIEFGGVTYWCH